MDTLESLAISDVLAAEGNTPDATAEELAHIGLSLAMADEN